MINASRPISIFSFCLPQDVQIVGKSFKKGQNQIIRGERLQDGSENPQLFVYHGEDFYRTSYLTLTDKCVKHVLTHLLDSHFEGGDFGDVGNEDMNMQ